MRGQRRVEYTVGRYLGKTSKLIVDGPNSFLDCLLESSTDTHDFSHTLHATAQQPAHAVELL